MINLKNLSKIDWRNISITDVLKGCAEHYFADYLDRGETYKAVVKYRLGICKECPIYVSGTCDPNQTIKHVGTGLMVSGCGCSINCKASLKSSFCPANKWAAID